MMKMTSEIEKVSESSNLWGDDPRMELVKIRDAGLVIADDLLQKAEARYLLDIRQRLQSDLKINKMAANASPAIDALIPLADEMRDLIKEGSEDIFLSMLEYVLNELDELRKAEPASYLIDDRTGKIVAPIEEDTIIRPDPIVDENGITQVQNPYINPILAASIALDTAAKERDAKIQKLAADPVSGLAYRHLTEPDRIVELAKEKLRAFGIIILDEPNSEKEKEIIEFGKETMEADHQAPNIRYHRLSVYSAVLATVLSKKCEKGGICWIGPIQKKINSKQRWYQVEALITKKSEMI
ncbi:MAG: hypothetical protein WC708_01540 [Lentisphaeria bacterium]|jgi:hypothetical protein